MKKLLSLCVVLAVILSLSGCCCLTIPKVDDGISSDEHNEADRPIQNDAVAETAPIFEDDEEEIWYDEPQIEETEADDNEIEIDSDTQYKLNLFLSNFAEARITQYPCCPYHKLRFVISHCQINGVGNLEYAHGDVFINKTMVDSILNTYTGTTITEYSESLVHTSCYGSDSIYFEEYFYYTDAGGGEYAGYVAIADSMFQNTDGTYTVHYNVYAADSDYFSDYGVSEFYSYSPSQVYWEENLEFCYSAKAIVQDYTRSGGQESYQLLSLERF